MKIKIGDRVVAKIDGSDYHGKVENAARDSRGMVYLVVLDIGGGQYLREDALRKVNKFLSDDARVKSLRAKYKR